MQAYWSAACSNIAARGTALLAVKNQPRQAPAGGTYGFQAVHVHTVLQGVCPEDPPDGSHPVTHRGYAFQVHAVRQGVYHEQRPGNAHPDTHRGEALQVHAVRQGVYPERKPGSTCPDLFGTKTTKLLRVRVMLCDPLWKQKRKHATVIKRYIVDAKHISNHEFWRHFERKTEASCASGSIWCDLLAFLLVHLCRRRNELPELPKRQSSSDCKRKRYASDALLSQHTAIKSDTVTAPP